ncbi:hypothetical protein OIE66_00740 [Nonomuraea sp. NBC_01738]|uniref:hypothetical protein n=1 Tax=Nonomuraea sp. NBC_01738 TaxID=2976003 RepID=UPI002E1058D8|nr:hypothetical protein OIE66_00740 [Nonomuraea sp. NBC_01738]
MVRRLESSITVRDSPAIVALTGSRTVVLAERDYLHDSGTATAFETRAAATALRIGAVRWVFAVPQVWHYVPFNSSARPLDDLPLGLHDQEGVTWLTFDALDGVEYGRVAYVRRPRGQPVFQDVEPFDDEVIALKYMAGYTLLSAFLNGVDS